MRIEGNFVHSISFWYNIVLCKVCFIHVCVCTHWIKWKICSLGNTNIIGAFIEVCVCGKLSCKSLNAILFWVYYVGLSHRSIYGFFFCIYPEVKETAVFRCSGSMLFCGCISQERSLDMRCIIVRCYILYTKYLFYIIIFCSILRNHILGKYSTTFRFMYIFLRYFMHSRVIFFFI